MRTAGVYIDANLLVLLVVGRTSRDLIAKHRRLQRFTTDDYERLMRLCDTVTAILVTPNTLTEASNLLAQHGEPERSRFLRVLRALIGGSKEIVVSSKKASGNDVFERLGLTDAALMEVVSAQTPLITVDLDLYHAALANGRDAAINFTHFQSL